MDQKFIKKYFRGHCSDEELEQILDWFQTSEGQTYLREHIQNDCRRLTEEQVLFLYPDVATEKIYNRIQKNKGTKQKDQQED